MTASGFSMMKLPFIQDGSFIMEKPVASHGLWDFLMEKV